MWWLQLASFSEALKICITKCFGVCFHSWVAVTFSIFCNFSDKLGRRIWLFQIRKFINCYQLLRDLVRYNAQEIRLGELSLICGFTLSLTVRVSFSFYNQNQATVFYLLANWNPVKCVSFYCFLVIDSKYVSLKVQQHWLRD